MATVVIKIAGTEITAAVQFSKATFESAVNGTVGQCRLRVRDDTYSMSFVTGSSIELLIDGDPVWTGYLMTVAAGYAFPAEDVSEATARWWDLTGSDLNILLQKRVVYNHSDPTAWTPSYPPYTADSDVIADLVTDALDLSGDGLDLSSGVVNVGDVNADQPTRPYIGADTWATAMNFIAALPAAVYFISPDRVLRYVDVNTEDAPFGLSDQPDGVTSVGYREMKLYADGTGLVTDELAWGYGYGSDTRVFKRVTDATALATHGRWQNGDLRIGIYKQASIDRVADSIINGSPTSHRGAKDDKMAVTLVTYVPGFLPAQKVAFESNAFGFSDVIPIRKMLVTFDAPDTPKYELTISHAIDAPWSFFDPWAFVLPRFRPPRPGGWPPQPSNPCGITDTFDRPAQAGWGTSDSGLVWAAFEGSSGDVQILSNVGLMTVDDPDVANGSDCVLGSTFAGQWPLTFQFWVGEIPSSGANGPIALRIRPTSTEIVTISISSDFDTAFGPPRGGFVELTGGSGDYVEKTNWLAATWYTYKEDDDGVNHTLKIWPSSDPEPASALLTDSSYADPTSFDIEGRIIRTGSDTPGHAINIQLDNLDIAGLNRCTCQSGITDRYDRTVASGWGTASCGYDWRTAGAVSPFSVSSGMGLVTSHTISSCAASIGIGPLPYQWELGFDFTFDAAPIAGTNDQVTDLTLPGVFLNIGGQEGPPLSGRNPSILYIGDSDITYIPAAFWVAGTVYHIAMTVAGDSASVIVSSGSGSYSAACTGFRANSGSGFVGYNSPVLLSWTYTKNSGSAADNHLTFRNLDISFVNNCTVAQAFDNFNRSVSGSWGTASSGPTWTQLTTGAPSISVVPGLMNVDWSGSSYQELAELADTGPWQDPAGFVVTIPWRPGDTSDGSKLIAVYTTGDDYCEFDIRADPNAGPGGGLIAVYSNADYQEVEQTVWDNVWYLVKAEYIPGSVMRVKVWKHDDPEPTGWDASCSAAGQGSNTGGLEITMSRGSATPPSGSGFSQVSKILFNADYASPAGIAVSVAPTGLFCQVFQRGSGTHYATSYPFLPGSTRLFIDGLRQTNGVNYTENADLRSVDFGFTILETSQVWGCYRASGLG